MSSTSSTISTRLPRTKHKSFWRLIEPCFRSTVELAVFVASSYSSSEIARMGFCRRRAHSVQFSRTGATKHAW